MPSFHGSDTSNNQGAGVIGIGPEIKALGGDAWWHKATQGSGFRDRYWPACRQARIDTGLRYGGPYHWLSPNVPVPDQFKNFRDFVGGLTVGEGIQLDIEDPAGLSDATVFEAIELWEDEWPGRVFHYMGHYYMGGLRQRCADRYGDKFRHWLAWYSTTFPNVGYTPVMWQYAGGATGVYIPSIGARVDSNEIHDRQRLDQASGYGGPQPPKEGADVPTILIIPNVAIMLSPSSTGKGHSHASWIEEESEVNYLAQFWPEETISVAQLGGIRLIGNAPDSLKALMHQGYSNLPPGVAVNVPAIVEASVAEVIRRLSNG